MYNTRALFALATIGSAELACLAVGNACTDGDDFIGMCAGKASGGFNCTVNEAICTGLAKDTACGQDVVKGVCATAGGKCKYVAATCIPTAADDSPCRDSNGLIGKCKGTSGTRTCTLLAECGTSSREAPCNSGNLKGTCVREGGQCKYKEAWCSVNTDPCKDSGNLIGKCGSGGKCDIGNLCATGALNKNAACSEGQLKGTCDEKSGTCSYTELVCSTAGISCRDTNGLIGKCDGSKCQIADMCEGKSVSEGCTDSSYLVGKCVTGGYCKYEPKACGTADEPCKDTGDLIGLCDVNQCKILQTCASKKANEPCSVTYSTKTSNGKCVDAGGTCRATGSVDVLYTVEVPSEDPEGIAELIGKEKRFFPAEAEVTSVGGACSVRNFPDTTYTNYTCPDDHLYPGKSGCTIQCLDGSMTKMAHTLKCESDETWSGVVGSCAKKCPAATGANTTDIGITNTQGSTTSNKITFVKKVEHGTLTCNDIFHDSGTNYCILGCNEGYRVKTKSKHGCSNGGNPAWGGEVGACEESVDVAASAKLVLGARDDSSSADFEKKFKEAVAKNLYGVDADHVEVISVKASTLRRLNENSVQVDYTIQVAKGDPEAETELDKVDDGRLLRGIQEGMRGIQ